jgi:hypothetical protein
MNLDGVTAWSEDNIIGRYQLQGGPGLFVLVQDGSYTCKGGLLSYTTSDPVDGGSITVLGTPRTGPGVVTPPKHEGHGREIRHP